MVLTWENLIQTVCLITGYSQQAYVAFYLGNFFYLIAVKIIFRLFLKILIFDFKRFVHHLENRASFILVSLLIRIIEAVGKQNIAIGQCNP